MNLFFHPAQTTNLKLINELIKSSKSYWNYSEEYLKSAMELLTIDADYLKDTSCFEIIDSQGKLICFCSIKEKNLDHLWVHPIAIRQGVGKFALEKLINFSKTKSLETLWVLPDPPVEDFYLKQGFQDSYERIASRIPSGPVFKKFYLIIK